MVTPGGRRQKPNTILGRQELDRFAPSPLVLVRERDSLLKAVEE